MKNYLFKGYVMVQTSVSMAKQSMQDIISGKIKEDEGSFLTENLGVVAITIALVAAVLIGMNTIIGGTGGGGTGVLGTLQTRITNMFAGTP